MGRIFVAGLVLALSLTLCVSLLAQEEKPGPPEPPKPEPAQGEKNEQDQQPEEPAEPEPTALEKCIKQLMSTSSQERELALKELVKMKEEAVPALNKILGVELMEKKADIPEELKAKIEKLIKDLDAEEWPVREAATKELEKIGEPAETHLRRVAKFGTLEAKTRAEKLLARLEEKGREGKSEEEVEQARFLARLCAIRALGEIGAKSCDRGLLAALSDKDKMINTTALMFLRKKSGWSFGFGPKDMEKNRDDVTRKWSDYLESPTSPAGEDAVELKITREAGDVLKTRSSLSFETVTTMRQTSTRVTMQGGKQKREEIINTYTTNSEMGHAQTFEDTLEQAGPDLLKFTRKYLQHKDGSNSYSIRAGNRMGRAGILQLMPTPLSGAELEYSDRAGSSDMKVLKGSVSLSHRDWLTANFTTLGVLLPGKPVRVGDSWDVPELQALRLLRSLGPRSMRILDASTVKLRCRLLEIVEKKDAKLARICVLADFGPPEDAAAQGVMGGNIARVAISTYGFGGLKSLAGSSLVGDCTFDMGGGTVTAFRLFGALFQPPEQPQGRFGNTNREQTSHGFFRLDVTGSRQKPEK